MIRRTWIGATAAFTATALARGADAQTPVPLDVAYAGSMTSMMEGPIKAGAAALGIDMHGRAEGSNALANLIVAGAIGADVFISVTPGPMETVLRAGKAREATPVARTEMVIAYSPRSRFAGAFASAATNAPGAMPWYRILEEPGLRFGRTDPATDPQGRNIVFTLQLAQAYYRQPGLAQRVLGDLTNPAQIFSEPTVEARLQSGELDAASAYRIQPGPFDLPYVTLPDEVNLGNASMHARYAAASLQLAGKTYRPEPLVYYAAVVAGTPHAAQAAAFVRWLTGLQGQAIFRRFGYDAPSGAAALR